MQIEVITLLFLLLIVFVGAFFFGYRVGGNASPLLSTPSQEAYAEYGQPAVADIKVPLGQLKARLLDLNQRVVPMSLDEAIQKAGANERIAVLSIDNPVDERRALEALTNLRRVIGKYIDEKLAGKGLKLARNQFDHEIILAPISSDGYTYMVGAWYFVQDQKSIA